MTTPRITRALLSVHDKNGIIAFAGRLHEQGAAIVSTGGTARAIAEAGVPVREVADLTGFPEMLDGRVKTLHPRIHAGLLAVRGNPRHMKQVGEQDVPLIDLVAVNLYPFERTRADRPDDIDGIIEMIDIGGPALVRSASKNFRDVVVIVDPVDYAPVIEEIEATGGVGAATRVRLAAKAFSHTAGYDAMIADFMFRLSAPDAGGEAGLFPDRLCLALRKSADLRYGENPHQAAALYSDPLEPAAGAVNAEQLHGKDLSFNNILDLDAAWNLVCDFRQTACAIIKHTNPAGVALGPDPAAAYRRALETDPLSAFGSIIAFNREVTAEAARAIASLFVEAVIAPSFHAAALEILKGRKNLRIMRAGEARPVPRGLDYKRIVGGLLAQERDNVHDDAEALEVMTRRAPTDEEREALQFAWIVARHVKSNAIVYARGTATAGVGAGQMSRVDAVKLGATKATGSLQGCVLASDAFFPFRDGIDEAARAGVTAIIQPGGSVRDKEVIAAADEHGIAMAFTRRRHFRH